MKYQFIKVSQIGHVWLMELNRPDKLNAMCMEMVREMNALFTKLTNEKGAKALFIFGQQKAFSAGGDLKELQQFSLVEAEKCSLFLQDTFRMLQTMEIPVVAFLSGVTFGGGLELAMHADMRIATQDTQLAMPEVKYNIIPGAGGTVLLPRFLPKGLAAWYLFTGENIPLETAFQFSLIQKIIDSDQLQNEIQQMAQRFNQSDTVGGVLSAIKKQLYAIDINDAYFREAQSFAQLLSGKGSQTIEKGFKPSKNHKK